jgi:putative Ca2+/H+ antiporter (TMEM165/GDT1 family)
MALLDSTSMEAFLVSTGVVALAELGDKSQLLVLGLAARFRKPIPIILGILVATLLNHALAGVVGASLGARIGPQSLRWLLGLSFVGVAAWMLLSNGREPAIPRVPRLGVFGTTLATFFMMEMGDKTQVVAMALAASYRSLYPVVVGSTAGILLADVPVVILGTVAAQKLPMTRLRAFVPVMFLLFGVIVLLRVGATR